MRNLEICLKMNWTSKGKYRTDVTLIDLREDAPVFNFPMQVCGFAKTLRGTLGF